MLTLPYCPIIVSAECLNNQAPGTLLEADLGGKSHADSHAGFYSVGSQQQPGCFGGHGTEP
jgi:hypothetical protein